MYRFFEIVNNVSSFFVYIGGRTLHDVNGIPRKNHLHVKSITNSFVDAPLCRLCTLLPRPVT